MKQKRNRRGSGQIEQRGDAFRLRFTVEGKRHAVTFTGTKAEARAELRRLTHAPDIGEHVAPSKQTVGAFVAARIDQWEASGDITGRTAQRYRELCENQIKPHIGDKLMQKLTSLDVENWHNVLRSVGRADGKGPLAPRTVGHCHRVLSKALKDGAKHKVVLRNVVAGDAAPGPDEDEEEMAIVIDVPSFVELLRRHPKHFVPATIALFTGMRLGEILALRWGRVDLSRKVIQVKEALEETKAGIRFKAPKSKAGKREISLPDLLVETLKVFRREQLELRVRLGAGKLADDALLFADIDGKPPSQKRCSKAWSDFADQIGMPELTFHSLRHSHASWLIATVMPIRALRSRSMRTCSRKAMPLRRLPSMKLWAIRPVKAQLRPNETFCSLCVPPRFALSACFCSSGRVSEWFKEPVLKKGLNRSVYFT